MNRRELEKFIVYLQKENWLVFGPTENGKKEVLAREIQKPEELVLDGRLPTFPFKHFFVPECEKLFEFQKSRLRETKNAQKTAILGINLLDLKAINLYDQVFEKDSYYQFRRRHLLVVGHSILPDIEDNIFEEKFEEDVLEHLSFDIFLATVNPSTSLPAGRQGSGNILPEQVPTSSRDASKAYKVFTGSLRGQRILEHFGYKNYTHIQFSGPVKEGKLDERMNLLREKLKNHHHPEIWEELGRRCIECGKCAIICPTCFCFRIDDEAGFKNSGVRNRVWDSCFFEEFSEVAERHKFLNSTAQRIHFWYFHKFARIPDEFDFMGCVGCRRCTRVCPVNIDIAEVLKDIENS